MDNQNNIINKTKLPDFGPLNVIIHHRDPQKGHPCVNPRLLSRDEFEPERPGTPFRLSFSRPERRSG